MRKSNLWYEAKYKEWEDSYDREEKLKEELKQIRNKNEELWSELFVEHSREELIKYLTDNEQENTEKENYLSVSPPDQLDRSCYAKISKDKLIVDGYERNDRFREDKYMIFYNYKRRMHFY